MKCKILARHASDLQEKGHFSCKISCTCKKHASLASRASFLQDLLALRARYTSTLARTLQNLQEDEHLPCKNLASMDLQDSLFTLT